MVKGIEKFREYFSEYADQYVLIGGTACDIFFGSRELDFRVTRDLDIVLIVEAQTKEFGRQFWNFIREDKYENRAVSSGKPQFYRFDKPGVPGYPSMIELFSRSDIVLEEETIVTPIHIDDAVSSLFAILLNEAYYELLLTGREVIDGISILKPSWLIPFKVKAWLDLNGKLKKGIHVDSRDIKKHRNDFIRICTELTLEKCTLSHDIKEDMNIFIKGLHITDDELRNLGVKGVHETDIINVLRITYGL
jgi:hypothetical protein